MRKTAKATLNTMALVLVLPTVLLYLVSTMLIGKLAAFSGWTQAFSILPGLSGAYLRRAFFRYTLAECGDNVHVSFGALISHSTARLKRNVYVGPYCCLGDITLEEDVLLGSHVSVMNGSSQHGIDRLDIPIREQPGTWPRVTIGADSWIGDRAIVMADVGRHCVVGAGAVVTKPIPDYGIAVGAPARVVKFRRQPADGTGDFADHSSSTESFNLP